jgi:hypothetical protein
MAKEVSPTRFQFAVHLDESWGKVNLAECRSVQVSDEYLDDTEILYKTPTKRWYVEERRGSSASRLTEVTIDDAMEWLWVFNEGRVPREFRMLEELPDVTRTEAPSHSGGIRSKCMNCYKHKMNAERLIESSRSDLPVVILAYLESVDSPRSAKEIAWDTTIKNHPHFRGILANLVQSGRVIKSIKPRGYVIAKE